MSDKLINTDYLLRISNLSQLICIDNNNNKLKLKEKHKDLCIIQTGCIIVNHSGLIEYVGTTSDLPSKYITATYKIDLDGTNKSLIPGLIDGHTHPVWAGDRCNEFKLKLAGATYMDIHKLGGGINFTVTHTRNASEEELLESLLTRLKRMLKLGTTTIEAKSGYGLNCESELKLLRVLHKASTLQPITIVSNYCGAHSVPKGSTSEEATKDIIENQIPAVVASNKNGETSATLIDVFCEKGVFNAEEAKAILKAGIDNGFLPNFHGDELSHSGSGELASEIPITAISHLECVTECGMKAMANGSTVATLLPTTALILRLHPPSGRALIDNNVAVALGSDYNPNAHCMSMTLTMLLACTNMNMSLEEALVASTLHSATSIGRDDIGSLEVGKLGDLLLINHPNWEHLVYEIGDPPIEMVIKKGVPVYVSN